MNFIKSLKMRYLPFVTIFTDPVPDMYRLPKQSREALEHGKDENLLLPH